MSKDYTGYIGFLGGYLWQEGPDQYLTSCACSPFITCGHYGFKLLVPKLLPVIGEYFKSWRFEFYFMRFWMSIAIRKHWRTGRWFKHCYWGFCKRDAAALRARATREAELEKAWVSLVSAEEDGARIYAERFAAMQPEERAAWEARINKTVESLRLRDTFGDKYPVAQQ